MRIRWTNLALAMGVMAMSASAVQAAPGHKRRPTHKAAHKTAHKVVHKAASGAESALVGVALFDNGMRVISLYGTPDMVQAANVPTVTANGGGGAPGGGFPGGPGGGRGGRFPGAPGGPGGRAPGAGPGGGGPSSPGAEIDSGDSNDFGDQVLRQARRPGAPAGMPGGPGSAGGPPGAPPGYPGGAPGGGYPGGPGGAGGRPGGFPGGGAPGGGGFPNSGGGQADNVIYTRWVYVRGASRYGFVFDKFNRVVQIEAIGIDNPKVHTRRGIGFGASFASLIKSYGAPDGYDIGGDSSLTVRYLVRSKVAFRLNRIESKKPPVVTGIVIAAAKG